MKEINIEGQLIYVAHPYGGNEENIRRAAECLRELKKCTRIKHYFPRCTIGTGTPTMLTIRQSRCRTALRY